MAGWEVQAATSSEIHRGSDSEPVGLSKANGAQESSVVKHTASFVIRDQNGRQFTVHELTSMIEVPPAPGETRATWIEGGKQYELRDSPGNISRLDEKTLELTFPFASTVTATVV